MYEETTLKTPSACNGRFLKSEHPSLFHIGSYFMDLGLDSLATKGTGLLNYSCNLHFLAAVGN